jgi:uncharacterized protein (TIGR00369 family)
MSDYARCQDKSRFCPGSIADQAVYSGVKKGFLLPGIEIDHNCQVIAWNYPKRLRMPENEPTRQRTITWEDPLPGAKQAVHLSGLAYIQAIQNGQIPAPPIAQLMGMHISEVAEGRVVFSLGPGEYHYNPVGVVHGGVAATLCDSAMACAVQTVLPEGMIYTTLELHVNYVRSMTANTGVVHCVGEVIHQGKRIATAQARLLDEQGRLYAHGTTTCMIFPLTQGGTA